MDGTGGGDFQDDLDLSIVGLGVAYPDFAMGPEAVQTLAHRHYPNSPAFVGSSVRSFSQPPLCSPILGETSRADCACSMSKVISINRYTGIDKRSAVGNVDHPLVNQPEPPSIRELNELFMQEGVRLSVSACEQAIAEWQGEVSDITHVVSTTCTNSANPGYDHFVTKKLGVSRNAEKVLLHGIGCSGGMAAMRTAANLALGASYRRKPARILVVACEISSVLVRSELESIHQNQEVRIGVALFSDCASACVISNGFGAPTTTGPIYRLLGWRHELIDDTHSDLGFDVDPAGWKVVLTPRVPTLTSAAVLPAFQSLLASVPDLEASGGSKALLPSDFDWALHPGGSSIIMGVQKVADLSEDHLLASYGVYVEHGNSSSATIMSVLDRSRREQKRDKVVACAFGPGICLEMMILRRGKAQAENGLISEAVD